MFESIIATLLNKYLAEYIDAVDYNNLKIGLFSGCLELLDIKIKPSALYQFDLPIEVKYGRIGKLKINLSWRKILSEAAVLEIEDLYVICGPFEDKIHDPKRIEEIHIAHKRKQLQEIEKIDEATIFEDDDEEQSYTEMITNTIINNIQVYIKNIHIRYEDKYSIKNKIVSFGIFLKEFRAETVDADGNPNFLNADEKLINKHGTLSGFNVYWNCNSIKDSLIVQQKEFEKNRDYCVPLLKESIDTGKILGVAFEKFLENDLDLKAQLSIRRSIDINYPKIILQSSVNAIQFIFQRSQYKNIIAVVDCYSLLNVHKQFVKYRPQEIETVKNSHVKAKLYWKYVFTATAESKWRHYKKERMLKHWRIYKEYIAKYKSKLIMTMAKNTIPEKDLLYLENLEKDLTLESIFDAREYCNDDLRSKKLTSNNNEAAKKELPESRPMNYVEMRFILNVPLIGLKLINHGVEILRFNFTHIVSRFESRPVAKSFYFLINTRSIDAFGIYYKDSLRNATKTEMVPMIRSKNEKNLADNKASYMATEDNTDMFFTLAFETNPISIQPPVEFSIRTRVKSLEVYYEKTCITEILNFFKSDTFGIENVVNIKKIQENVWSKAGVIFAVENHKQFHVSAELSSPYFVIPAKGTMKDPGNSIVFFLGNTHVQSDLEQKKSISSTTDVHELEKNFYDKLNLNVNEVQVMLVPYNIDLTDYLENCAKYDFKYHLLYPVSTDNKVYLSIDPKYKKLPKLKIIASCPSIRLNFSDNKIVKLFNFAQEFPLPEVPKYPAAAAAPALVPPSSPVAPAPPITVTKKEKSTSQKKIKKKKSKKEKENNNDNDSEDDESDDEWEGCFRSPTKINGNPIPNYSQLLFKFNIEDFAIDIKGTDDIESEDPIEHDYFGLILNAIKLDFSINKYGFALKAGLGNLRLLDKFHRTHDNQFTEFLSSVSTEELIRLSFRQVEPEAPNFASLYLKTLTKISFKCSKIQLVCHRTAIIYFILYSIKLTEKLTIKKVSEIDGVIEKPTSSTADTTVKKSYDDVGVIELNVEATMNELTWKMYDNDLLFGNMQVTDLYATHCLSGVRTDLQVKLKTIYINYENTDEVVMKQSLAVIPSEFSDPNINDSGGVENTASKILTSYKQIISCTAEENAENFFDFRIVFFDTSNETNPFDFDKYKDSIYLNIGKIKVICLVKFVNELILFIEPIINPLPNLATQIKDQAIEAANMVKNAYTEAEQIKKIFLNINLSSPVLIIPQNSVSLNAFLVLLGNLTVTNQFIKYNYLDQTYTIDEIDVFLTNVEIKRIKYKKLEPNEYHERENVVFPINLTAKVSRTLSECPVLPDLKLSLNLSNLDTSISLITLKLLFAILDENLNEGIKDDIDKVDSLTPALPENNTESTKSHTNPSTSIETRAGKSQTDPVDETDTHKTNKIIMELNVVLNQILVKIVELKVTNVPNNNVDVVEKIDFSRMVISKMDFSYLKYQSAAWNAYFKMKALNLVDTRPDSNLAVKDMFMPIDPDAYFIELVYATLANQDSNLDFTIDHLRINLCLPYILKLYQIAMEAISSPNKEAKKVPEKKKTQEETTPVIVEEENNSTMIVKARIKLPEVVLFAEPEKSNSKILLMNVEIGLFFQSKDGNVKLNIDLNEMEIRLGEYNHSHRHGIPFLSPCGITLVMTQNKGESLAYYKLEIDTLLFNMTPTLYQVVMGVINTINRSGTETKHIESAKQKLLEDSEPFKVHFDTDAQKNVQKRDEIAEEPDEENEIDVIETNDVSMEIDPALKGKVTKLLETLELNINEAYIKLCEESSIDLQPLAIVKLTLRGQVSNWTKNLHVKANIELEASYYNDKISNWEPLIDNVIIREDVYRPWNIRLWFAIEEGGMLQPPLNDKGLEFFEFPVKDLEYSAIEKAKVEDSEELIEGDNEGSSSMWQNVKSNVTSKVLNYFEKEEESAEIIDLEEEVEIKNENLGNASYINIESSDMLNLNVTPSAYNVIMYLAQITAGSQEQEFLENKSKLPYKFLNFLGEPSSLNVPPNSILKQEYVIGFDFNMKNHLKKDSESGSMYHSLESIQKESSSLIVAPSEKVKVRQVILNSNRSQIDSVYDEKYKFNLQVEGFESVKLSLRTNGSFLIQLKEVKKKKAQRSNEVQKSYDMIKYNIMYKIRTNYGRAKVIFSSPLQIENHCKIKLMILVDLTDSLNKMKSKFNILKEIQVPNVSVHDEAHDGPATETTSRKYAVLFELLPSKIFYVPLYFAYNCKLYVTPQSLQYAPAQIFDIRGYNLRKDDVSEVNCKRLPTPDDADIDYENNEKLLIGTNDIQFTRQLSLNVRSHKNVMPSMHANYKVLLFSPLKLINTLPFEFRIDIDNESTYSTQIQSGESLFIHLKLSKLSCFQIHVNEYLGTSWVGKINWPKHIESKLENQKLEMILAPTNELYVSGKHLSIYIHFQRPNEFTFYSPYWLVNKSGMPINIKSSDSPKIFVIPEDEILLFDFKDPLKKNKVEMNIKDGQWSTPFSIDAAGTTGMIQCKERRRTNTFLMRVTMSNASRAKLVTFAPFLSVANQLDESIAIAEWNKMIKNDAAYRWKNIEPAKSTAIFPSYGSDKQLCFMIKTADNYKSKPFPLENPGRFVVYCKSTNSSLEVEHKIFTVLISGGSLDPVTIIIRKYQYGDSVAKFINLCEDITIDIKEPTESRSQTDTFTQSLNPFESFFFVWPDYMKQTRELTWTVQTNDSSLSLKYFLSKSGMHTQEFIVEAPIIRNDPSSESEFNEDYEKSLIKTKTHSPVKGQKRRVEVTCLSYIDDTQRVIMFTTNHLLVETEQKKEAASMEIFLSLRGVQISIINNVNLEIANVGIIDSIPTWALINTEGTKIFSQENSTWLDKKYVEYHSNIFNPDKTKAITPDMASEECEVLFDKMQLIKPDKGQLKRYWDPGLKVQYRTSTNLMSLKCAIYKLQIDNQLPDAYFPISFYKAPISLSNHSIPVTVPFITLDMFTEQQEVTQIYRYFNCTLQEFYLKVDKGLLLSVKDWYDAAIMKTDTKDQMFTADEEEMEEPDNILVIIDSDKELIDHIKDDIKLTRQIMEFQNQEGGVKQSAHIRFDNFIISPINFNLSFSVNGTVHTDDKEVQSNATVLYFLLESVGSTISEFKDVKFHFNSFEIDNHTKTWNDMYDEIFNHYKVQVLHQAYVLIFGLDVLGNPFGLVSEFSQGLTDLFYDPLIDYLKKKDENKHLDFEMRAKIKATVNKTISSVAGSGSLITGSIGRMLSTISFDKEYKRRRQYKLSKAATTGLSGTLTLAGKNVVAGMVYGVTGIVESPIKECAASKKYIFKGIGKGVTGLIVKPLGSIFDSLSLSLDGLKRFAQSGSEQIASMRLPRHLIQDVPIQPFSEYLAEGYEILRDLQNDNIAIEEIYWAHLNFRDKNKEILFFITDVKIYQLQNTRTQILAKWREYEKAIPLNKVEGIEIVDYERHIPDLSSNHNHKLKLSRKPKRNMSVPSQIQNTMTEYDLYIKFASGEIFDRKFPDMKKKVLVTSSYSNVQWLAEKIDCVIKYYKESRLKINNLC